QERFPVEAHPADAEAFCGGCQPEILDRKTHRVQPGVGNGVSTEHVGGAAFRIVGDHDTETRLHDSLNLDVGEFRRTVVVECVREDVAFATYVFGEPLPCRLAVDQHEVPWLAQSHTRCGVGGLEDPLQGLLLDLFAGEFAPHIAACAQYLIEIHVMMLRSRVRSPTAVPRRGWSPLGSTVWQV